MPERPYTAPTVELTIPDNVVRPSNSVIWLGERMMPALFDHRDKFAMLDLLVYPKFDEYLLNDEGIMQHTMKTRDDLKDYRRGFSFEGMSPQLVRADIIYVPADHESMPHLPTPPSEEHAEFASLTQFTVYDGHAPNDSIVVRMAELLRVNTAVGRVIARTHKGVGAAALIEGFRGQLDFVMDQFNAYRDTGDPLPMSPLGTTYNNIFPGLLSTAQIAELDRPEINTRPRR